MVRRAVSEAAASHPIMCCGIQGEDTPNPVFVRLENIDISSCVTFSPQDDKYFHDSSERTRLLAQILNPLHETCFADLETLPGWRVVVVLPNNGCMICQIDIVFVWHHGVLDGLSGRLFHQTLLKEVNYALDSTETKEDFVLSTPRVLEIPPPIENAMHFPVTWRYYLYQCWQQYAPRWILSWLPARHVGGPTQEILGPC